MRLGLVARAAIATARAAGRIRVRRGSDSKEPTSVAVHDESPSASPTPTDTPPQVPTTARNTSAGRIAFATYFVKASNYAYATNDATPITSVGSPGSSYGCSMCTELKTFLDGQKAKGLHLEPADLPVKRAFETAHIRHNVWVVDIESSAAEARRRRRVRARREELSRQGPLPHRGRGGLGERALSPDRVEVG